MNGRPPHRGTADLRDEPEDELPPMADDEEGGDVDTPIDSLIEEQRDDGMTWLDDRVGIDDYDAETIADEIGAVEGEEPIWTEGSEGDDRLEGTDADLDFGEEYGWTEDNEEPEPGTFDDDLDFGREGGPSVLEDGGEEGLDDEDIELDTSAWKDLDEEEGEGTPDLEEIDLGLSSRSFEQEQRASGELLPVPLDESQLKAAWLGPPGAPATTVTFGESQLWAAGSGLFLPQEGRLVAAPSSRVVEDAEATSVVIDPEAESTLYIGTLLGGLLRSDDGGATLRPVNSWTAQAPGCGRPQAPSVPVQVAATRGPGASTLWLRTGTGRLLASEDRGESWRAVAEGWDVRAVAADPRSDLVAALAVRGRSEVVVLTGRGGGELRPRPVPEVAHEALVESPSPTIAVAGDAVAVGAEELDHGIILGPSTTDELRLVEDCPRCTALALRPGPELTVLAGLFFAGKDLGAVLRSLDGGRSWVRVCDVGRLEHLFDVDLVGYEDTSPRIRAISLNPMGHGQAAMATGFGVFVVEMKDL